MQGAGGAARWGLTEGTLGNLLGSCDVLRDDELRKNQMQQRLKSLHLKGHVIENPR